MSARLEAPRGEAGFTLVEALVALAIFLLGVALAAQLLMETAQRLSDLTAQQTAAPVSLVRARIRADLEAARAAQCVREPGGAEVGVRAFGHPTGTIVYRVEDQVLWRSLEEEPTAAPVALLPGVEGFACWDGAVGLVGLELHGWRRSTRRTPLVVAPAARRPGRERWTERLWVAPRGGGLGAGW